MLVNATRASALPACSRRLEGDRQCSFPGCDTRLCAYNRYPTCFLHTQPRTPRLRGRKPR